MGRRSQGNDHIDHNELIDAVHSVEDYHKGSVLAASDEEMAAIWKLTGIEYHSHRIVNQHDYEIIKHYAAKGNHKSYEKADALRLLGKSYSWLMHRVFDYRHGRLQKENEDNE